MANPGESPTALTVNPSILYQAWGLGCILMAPNSNRNAETLLCA